MTEHMYTNAELEELAVLDAWGLLDSDEQGRFESAFAVASPERRAALRSIQDECTGVGTGAEDQQWQSTSSDLRQRVLSRLQALRDLEAIGGATPAGHALSLQPTPAPAAQTSFLGSAWTWRMAALVLLAVSLTVMVMHQATRSQHERLLDEFTVLQALRTIEHDLNDDQQATFIAMMRRPDVHHAYVIADEGSGMVRLAIDEKTGEAFVLAMDLTGQAAPCTLELETADGDVVTVASLRTDRHIDAHALTLDPALLNGATLRLRNGAGDIIGSSLA